MILQTSFDWMQFIYVMIGSFFGTLFGLLAKYIIDKLKNRSEIKELTNYFKKLFELLSGKHYQTLGEDVYNLLSNKIGESYIYDVLKMRETFVDETDDFEFNFECREFTLYIELTRRDNIKIYNRESQVFNYSKPEENINVRQNFLRYFSNSCEEYFKNWNKKRNK